MFCFQPKISLRLSFIPCNHKISVFLNLSYMTALGFVSPGSMQQSISEPMWGGGIMTPNDTCLWLRAKGTCHVTTVTALLDRAAPCGYTFATTFSGSLMLFIFLLWASTMRGRWERLAVLSCDCEDDQYHLTSCVSEQWPFAAGNLRVGDSLLSVLLSLNPASHRRAMIQFCLLCLW